MTIKMYLESYALVATTVVTGLTDELQPLVRLRETLFHPQGGGQRGDRGLIGPAHVLDTRHAEGGEVDHLVDSIAGLEVGETVNILVDANHRRRGALLHSGGHLIADAMKVLRPSTVAVAGHHWENEARVEFEGDIQLGEGLADDLGALLDKLIEANLQIRIEGDPFRNRSIKIGDFEAVGCGGTHAARTAELAGLRITAIRKKGARLRVSYQTS